MLENGATKDLIVVVHGIRGRSGGQQRWRDEETHSRGGGRYVAPHRRNGEPTRTLTRMHD